MVGKKSGKALRDEGMFILFLTWQSLDNRVSNIKLLGLERTDNNMDLSSWPQVAAINQKNYYT
jgi:actin-related protein 8